MRSSQTLRMKDREAGEMQPITRSLNEWRLKKRRMEKRRKVSQQVQPVSFISGSFIVVRTAVILVWGWAVHILYKSTVLVKRCQIDTVPLVWYQMSKKKRKLQKKKWTQRGKLSFTSWIMKYVLRLECAHSKLHGLLLLILKNIYFFIYW